MSQSPTPILRAPCAEVAQLATSASALVSQLAEAVSKSSDAAAELNGDPNGTCDLKAVHTLLTESRDLIQAALPDAEALLVAVDAEAAWRVPR